MLSFYRNYFKTSSGTHLSDNCLSLCFSFHGSYRTITHWFHASRFMYIALKTFGLLAGGGYHSSTTVNGVRWCSTFWSRSTWKHFAYVVFKVSIYTWVEHNHQVLDFSRVPFVRRHLNSLCFYHFVLEAHPYRNHLTDTLIGSHSCLSGVELKSVNLNWN